MRMTVNDRSRAIATFRFIQVKLMELAAAWTPSTPEMEAKVMFGRHIWDFAQHADALGKRTFELRQPEQYTLPADTAYQELLHRIASADDTAERIAGLYEVIVPGLIRRYENYISGTDPILDEPTVVIMERIIGDLTRQMSQARSLMKELGLKATAQAVLPEQEMAIPHLAAAGATA
jgi:hypothetical protein